MIETKFHLFQIERIIIFVNSMILMESLFSIAPEAFYSINMIVVIYKFFLMIYLVMLSILSQIIITFSCISLKNRPFFSFIFNLIHQSFCINIIYNYCINLAFSLEMSRCFSFCRRHLEHIQELSFLMIPKTMALFPAPLPLFPFLFPPK